MDKSLARQAGRVGRSKTLFLKAFERTERDTRSGATNYTLEQRRKMEPVTTATVATFALKAFGSLLVKKATQPGVEQLSGFLGFKSAADRERQAQQSSLLGQLDIALCAGDELIGKAQEPGTDPDRRLTYLSEAEVRYLAVAGAAKSTSIPDGAPLDMMRSQISLRLAAVYAEIGNVDQAYKYLQTAYAQSVDYMYARVADSNKKVNATGRRATVAVGGPLILLPVFGQLVAATARVAARSWQRDGEFAELLLADGHRQTVQSLCASSGVDVGNHTLARENGELALLSTSHTASVRLGQ
ncbi:hypothetical protein ACFVUS_24045 [Nocardia sp. NPDC058058]|uniref:hypothetical protein n=1 Tax=Nocardia sp. NPDC058058 TaxID=3346317 RepID=UPI0036DD2CF4